MEEAEYLCDKIIIMDKGKILAQGTLDELLSANNSKEIIEFSTFDTFPSNFFCDDGVFKLEWDDRTNCGKLIVKSIVDEKYLEDKQRNMLLSGKEKATAFVGAFSALLKRHNIEITNFYKVMRAI